MSAIPALFLLLASTAAAPADRFGEACTGTETVEVGAQPPRTLPYSLTFSVDLATKSYCYGACGKDQTYPISDPASVPMTLSDVKAGDQVRRLTFDRSSATIEDYQVIDAGLGRITRRASGTCKPAAFHAPG